MIIGLIYTIFHCSGSTVCRTKLYLTLTLYFEAVTTLMLGISGFPVSPYLYDSFDTLLICFDDMMNK